MNSGVGTRVTSVCWLRTRVHSVLWKKNNRFLRIGPPTAYPNWLRVKMPRGMPRALLSKLLEASAEMRLNS
jgi:hypothetical protein